MYASIEPRKYWFSIKLPKIMTSYDVESGPQFSMFTQNMSSILHFGVGVTRIDRFMIEVGLNLRISLNMRKRNYLDILLCYPMKSLFCSRDNFISMDLAVSHVHCTHRCSMLASCIRNDHGATTPKEGK
jgi:hypothetical protein